MSRDNDKRKIMLSASTRPHYKTYQYESYVNFLESNGHQEDYSSIVHTDKYSWDVEEEEQKKDDLEAINASNVESGIIAWLLAVLTPEERKVVTEKIWNNRNFHNISFMFPLHDDKGKPLFDQHGRPKFHDNKWVKRRYESALTKMSEAHIPAHIRMGSTYQIPYRKKNEQGKTTGNTSRNSDGKDAN